MTPLLQKLLLLVEQLGQFLTVANLGFMSGLLESVRVENMGMEPLVDPGGPGNGPQTQFFADLLKNVFHDLWSRCPPPPKSSIWIRLWLELEASLANELSVGLSYGRPALYLSPSTHNAIHPISHAL